MLETFLSLPQCSSQCSRRCMAPYSLHNHNTYGLSYKHRRVILVRDRQHPSWALWLWITTLTCLSFLPPLLDICRWLLPADTIGPSVIFINVKYVLLCLQLWKFKWNLNCKEKKSNENSYCVICQRFVAVVTLLTSSWTQSLKPFTEKNTLYALFCSTFAIKINKLSPASATKELI